MLASNYQLLYILYPRQTAVGLVKFELGFGGMIIATSCCCSSSAVRCSLWTG
jgi:hypothetical protein